MYIDKSDFITREDEAGIMYNARIHVSFALPEGVYISNKMPPRFARPTNLRDTIMYIPSFYYKDSMDIFVLMNTNTNGGNASMSCIGVVSSLSDMHLWSPWATIININNFKISEFENIVKKGIDELIKKLHELNKSS